MYIAVQLVVHIHSIEASTQMILILGTFAVTLCTVISLKTSAATSRRSLCEGSFYDLNFRHWYERRGSRLSTATTFMKRVVSRTNTPVPSLCSRPGTNTSILQLFASSSRSSYTISISYHGLLPGSNARPEYMGTIERACL